MTTNNLYRMRTTVTRQDRAQLMQQRPCVIWLTGLSGAGKSTIANLLDTTLHQQGQHTYLLDGDNVRYGLCQDLGFSAADRGENIRRVAETAKLMIDAGLIVITAFISPFRHERRMARQIFEQGEFFEVFINTPLQEAERRDPKGLYKKARMGELKDFTGIDSPYEPPECPEIEIPTLQMTPQQGVDRIIAHLRQQKILPQP